MSVCVIRGLILSLLFLIPATGSAQETFFRYLAEKKPERVEIYCEWDTVLAVRDDTPTDGKVVLVWKDSTESWNAEITPRGKFRRARCGFPPLEINLKKGALRDHGFLEFDKLKVVTHCTPDIPRPDDLYEELLVYRLYNHITPVSYDVLTFDIDYLYPDGKPHQKKALALLIEPTAELAHRVGGIELEGFGVVADSFDPAGYCRAALFQFMIGNTDWSQTMQRNIKMIGKPGEYHLVPYDFDFSALVMPPYARMPSDYGHEDFRDRVYIGEYFKSQLPETIAEFREKKNALLQCVMDYPHLNKTRRNEIAEYLEAWFVFIENAGASVQHGTMLRYAPED